MMHNERRAERLVAVFSEDRARDASVRATLEAEGYRALATSSIDALLVHTAGPVADAAVVDLELLERLPKATQDALRGRDRRPPLIAMGPQARSAAIRERMDALGFEAYVTRDDQDALLIAVSGWTRRYRAWCDAERWTAAQGRTLLESLSAAVIWIDVSQHISEWNNAATKLFGLSRDSVLGTPFRNCPIEWADPSMVERVLKVAGGKEANRIDDVRFRRRDGYEGFLGMTVNVVSDPGGARELLILARDITPHKQHSAQILQSQKLEAIGQLAAGVAHEINTPIQYVGDNLNFLRDAFEELMGVVRRGAELAGQLQASAGPAAVSLDELFRSSDVAYLLEQIPSAISQSTEGTDRVGQIVRAMKEFSHPGTVEKAPFDVNEGIKNTVTVSRNEWKYVAETRLELDPTLPQIRGLPGEINQVLLNLIVNAAHAIGDVVGGSGERGLITLRTRPDGDHVRIEVTDTGTGIPEHVRSKIFDPFFTTKEVGKGTGQGLAIARSVVVDKHKGSIDVESTVGVGTTFIIRLPLGESDAPKT